MGMASESTTAASIRVVADAAHSLHERARISGPDFEEVAPVVKNLETVLKHLRVEAEDPDSLLNTQQQETSVYARQLTPIIEDCDFTLKQLSTIFEKFGHSDDARNSNGPAPYHPAPPPFSSSSSSSHHPSKDGADGQGKDMIALIRTKLANQRSNLEMFLDTVQLHNPAKQRMPPPTTGDQMEKIKDKVDEVAGRLFRRARRGGEDDEDLWRQFCHELEKEGFAGQVLRQNKEVIRAYLRGLDSNGMLDGTGPPPSVRGILPSAAVHPSAYSPHPPATGDTSPKEVMHPTFENEKYAISVKQGRVLPAQGDQNRQLQQQHLVPHAPPPPPGLYNQDSALSYDRYTSSDDEYGPDSSHQLALISTWELLTLDKQEQDHLAARMGAMHLAPQPLLPGPTASPGTSPNQRYLPAPVPSKQSHLLPPVAPPLDLSISPRYVPPLPAYSAALTPPPAYGSSPVVPQPLPSSFPGVGHAVTPEQARYSRLAPDSQGRDIPLDAKWTKIKRSLVSTEVLAQAGVRYEARPEFVAVLGVLTKADIAEFARRSAEIRRMRMRGPGRQQTRSAHAPRTRHRTGSTSDSESDVLWDESDSSEDERDVKRRYDRGKYIPKSVKGDKGPAEEQKGTKVYPFIVSPPNGENKASPSATVKPKPILKNKNENHVRFDRDGPIEIPPESERSPRSSRDEMDRERRQRHRDYDRDYDRDNERERDRRRRRDRDRDREREYPLRGSRHRREERDRERERDRDRPGKKKWGETLGAVGIGGAAASLLSVLTEAASGF